MAPVKYKVYTPLWNLINNKPIKKHFLAPSNQINTSAKVGFFGFRPIKLNNPVDVKKIPLKNLTWPQASVRFPKMNPFGDKDRDGKLNMFDCRPFNKKRHGDIVPQTIITKPVPEFLEPPEEYDTGEILDPYYDQYLESQEAIKVHNALQTQQAQQNLAMTAPTQEVLSTFPVIQKKTPPPQKWARPGIYNESDYLEGDAAIDEYVGSGTSSATPVRGFNPAAGGNKYG